MGMLYLSFNYIDLKVEIYSQETYLAGSGGGRAGGRVVCLAGL